VTAWYSWQVDIALRVEHAILIDYCEVLLLLLLPGLLQFVSADGSCDFC